MEQYLALIQDNIRPCIVKPKIGDDVKFEINVNFMKELRHKNFKGTDDEDAHEHVRRVLEIANLFHFPSVTHDVVMLRVFPVTLKEPTLRWKNRLSIGLITTWDLLEKAFIGQYCPPFKTAKKLEEIRMFKQDMDETLYHAWERYSDILYRCSQHDLNSHHKFKANQLTRMVLTNAGERVKAKTKIGKKDMKESVPRDLLVVQPYVPPTPFPRRLKKQKDNP
ncbi:RNA-directed DNA polymerase, eukaryota, nucleotide-binding alpha-beta plait domain protein [Tanacetum coccineum]|uniref:RNA-directed DNA polymerase, eukaryota, nucleotide-binding alpha-beta plait domain protein n=1 Tax=Tanacetum coccineum TaxID=301880 RepID=A0ABQ5H3S9_9ASTR